MVTSSMSYAHSMYVLPMKAENLPNHLMPGSVDLLLTDPPYYGVVDEAWDNQWPNAHAYAQWLADVLLAFKPTLAPDASILVFQAMGKHGCHPVFDVVRKLENGGYHFRNWITWKKRRAYGKSHDYLYIREEILWFSMSPDRTQVRFNVPLLSEKRGYSGFSKAHPAHSEYKRVGNVMTDAGCYDLIDDCPELMRPERRCQKPQNLMRRLVETHSHPGDLVVDPFAGWGSTGVAALSAGRGFLGCEAITEDAAAADRRCSAAAR